MSDQTKIEWCDATFNPWWGCVAISPGCNNCYAEAWAKRVGFKIWGVDAPRRMFDGKHWREPLGWNAKPFYECRECGWRGETKSNCPNCAAEVHAMRRRVFCASMADVFENHPGVDDQRPELWTLIHKTPNLDWLLLTKRVGNVARMVPPSWMSGHWPKHAWLGISVVNQEEADRDIPKLLALPPHIRFLSCEPLLGPIDIAAYLYASRARIRGDSGPQEVHGQPTLDWIISGGESGPQARPSHPDWHRSLRDQCAAAGVPFLFKQWGEWAPVSIARRNDRWSDDDVLVKLDGTTHTVTHDDHTRYDASDVPMLKIGKKAAGRVLDGREHNDFPA